jgi:hypothetical protein
MYFLAGCFILGSAPYLGFSWRTEEGKRLLQDSSTHLKCLLLKARLRSIERGCCDQVLAAKNLRGLCS